MSRARAEQGAQAGRTEPCRSKTGSGVGGQRPVTWHHGLCWEGVSVEQWYLPCLQLRLQVKATGATWPRAVASFKWETVGVQQQEGK